MRRKISKIRVHDMQIVIPGIGQLEKELPPTNKSLPTEMWIDSEHPGIVFVKVAKHETFIPLANVQIGFMEPESGSTK